MGSPDNLDIFSKESEQKESKISKELTAFTYTDLYLPV